MAGIVTAFMPAIEEGIRMAIESSQKRKNIDDASSASYSTKFPKRKLSSYPKAKKTLSFRTSNRNRPNPNPNPNPHSKMRRRRKEDVEEDDINSFGFQSRHKKPPRELSSLVNQIINKPIKKHAIQSFQLDANSNQCAYFSDFVNSMVDLNGMFQVVEAYLPNRENTSGQLFTSPHTTERLNIYSSSVSYMIANRSNADTFLNVYECECRKDVPQYKAGGAGFGLAASVDWSQSSAISGLTAPVSQTSLGGTFFDNSIGVVFWKVKKVHKYKLGLGDTKSLHFDCGKHEGLVNWTCDPGIYAARRGLTKMYMFQVWGDIAVDKTDGHFATVETGINVIKTENYEYGLGQQPPPTDYSNANSAVSLANALVWNQEAGANQAAQDI